jgi:formylglycine-generating enzyme required for sulfatase activity
MGQDRKATKSIDSAKFKELYRVFGTELNGKMRNAPSRWLKEMRENSEKWISFLPQDNSIAELEEELQRLTKGKITFDDLRFNQDLVILSEEDADKASQKRHEREAALASFKSKLEPFENRQHGKSSKKGKSGSSSSDNDKVTGFDYVETWKNAFAKAIQTRADSTDALELEPHFCPFFDKLHNHRLDRFIWPAVQYRRGTQPLDTHINYLDDSYWKTLETENEILEELTEILARNRIVLMHDDAGMGKTAFSWMLFKHLLSKTKNFPQVIRLEGNWPLSRDNPSNHLNVMEALLEEFSGRRLIGHRFANPNVNSRYSEHDLKEYLKANDVFILLDGFDQMTPTDRTTVVKNIEETMPGKSEIQKCHWVLSGRSFAFRDDGLTKIVREQNVLRFRLKRFNKERQDEYFKDLEKLPFFSNQEDEAKRKPLDFMCSTWRAGDDTNDLGIPLHLSEIRKVIEDKVKPINTEVVKTLGQINSSADLHARVSNVYLERVVTPTLNLPDLRPRNMHVPRDLSTKIKVLRQVCSCLAIQMMFDCNYNASIDNGGTTLIAYVEIAEQKRVEEFIARSRKRYEQLVGASESYWDWAIDLLEKIEVTHRGDVDTFTPDCRAFRDFKSMEWYSAYYLVNYSTEADWNERIDDYNLPNAKSWQGDKRWTRCWQLAMEMPANFYIERKLQNAIVKVFAPPPQSQQRPFEWMWIAWVNRLERDDTAIRKDISPLKCSEEVIAEFRKPFQELIAAQNPTALTLQYSAERDAPDFTLKHPNQTKYGWYRRIPDVGDFTKYKGVRPEVVKVSPFWMRKFVVTVEEYRLFDASHPARRNLEDDDLPVTGINWFSATMFCYWLGPGYHLPTSAEWETACKANELKNGALENQTDFWFGNNVDEAPVHAWISHNSQNRPHCLADSIAVADHQNRFGLFDMSGNVDEWCSDWRVEYFDDVSNWLSDANDEDKNDSEHVNDDVTDPNGPSMGVERVIRGGSFSSTAKKSEHLTGEDPCHSFASVGFRVALNFYETTEPT